MIVQFFLGGKCGVTIKTKCNGNGLDLTFAAMQR